MDAHLMALVIDRPTPMGIITCPQVDCPCGSTWRANTARSTPQEISQTRQLVKERMLQHGLQIPDWLR